eukprot:jgi/Mesvir1/5225/Mv15354-RA.1
MGHAPISVPGKWKPVSSKEMVCGHDLDSGTIRICSQDFGTLATPDKLWQTLRSQIRARLAAVDNFSSTPGEHQQGVAMWYSVFVREARVLTRGDWGAMNFANRRKQSSSLNIIFPKRHVNALKLVLLTIIGKYRLIGKLTHKLVNARCWPRRIPGMSSHAVNGGGNHRAIIDFVNLSYTVPGKRKRSPKAILNNVNGQVHEGELTACMGPSGSGKTTLLDVIAGRCRHKSVTGDVVIAGVSRYRAHGPTSPRAATSADAAAPSDLTSGAADADAAAAKSIPGNGCPQDQDGTGAGAGTGGGGQVLRGGGGGGVRVAYVLQTSTMMETLSVRENLLFSAVMRLRMPVKECAERVEQVIKDLRLTKCADTYIGGELVRGVSGGERRRTSIGMELVIKPTLVLMDEPTSGLDASTAVRVVQLLNELATSKGHTVIISIHSPNYKIYSLMQSLVLLGQGMLVYIGPVAGALDLFEDCGLLCGPFTNPADFFLDILTGELTKSQRQALIARVDGEAAGAVDREPGAAGAMKDLVPSAREETAVADGKARALDIDTLGAAPPLSDDDDFEEDSVDNGGDQRSVLITQALSKHFAKWRTLHMGGSGQSLLSNSIKPRATKHTLLESASKVRRPASPRDGGGAQAPHAWGPNGGGEGSPSRVPGGDGGGGLASPVSLANGEATGGGVRELTGRSKYARSWLFQTREVAKRRARAMIRNRADLIGIFVAMPMTALIIGLIYLNRDSSSQVQDVLGFAFLVNVGLMFRVMSLVVSFVAARAVFINEKSNRYYYTSAYVVGVLLCDIIPINVFHAVSYGSIIYWMLGFQADGGRFLMFLLYCFMLCFTSYSAAMAYSSIFSSAFIVENVLATMFTVWMIFGGLLINLDSIPNYFVWLEVTSGIRYGYEGIVVNELQGLDLKCDDALSGGFPCRTSEQVIRDLGMKEEARFYNVAILGGFIVGFLLIAYIGHRRQGIH